MKKECTKFSHDPTGNILHTILDSKINLPGISAEEIKDLLIISIAVAKSDDVARKLPDLSMLSENGSGNSLATRKLSDDIYIQAIVTRWEKYSKESEIYQCIQEIIQKGEKIDINAIWNKNNPDVPTDTILHRLLAEGETYKEVVKYIIDNYPNIDFFAFAGDQKESLPFIQILKSQDKEMIEAMLVNIKNNPRAIIPETVKIPKNIIKEEEKIININARKHQYEKDSKDASLEKALDTRFPYRDKNIIELLIENYTPQTNDEILAIYNFYNHPGFNKSIFRIKPSFKNYCEKINTKKLVYSIPEETEDAINTIIEKKQLSLQERAQYIKYLEQVKLCCNINETSASDYLKGKVDKAITNGNFWVVQQSLDYLPTKALVEIIKKHYPPKTRNMNIIEIEIDTKALNSKEDKYKIKQALLKSLPVTEKLAGLGLLLKCSLIFMIHCLGLSIIGAVAFSPLWGGLLIAGLPLGATIVLAYFFAPAVLGTITFGPAIIISLISLLSFAAKEKLASFLEHFRENDLERSINQALITSKTEDIDKNIKLIEARLDSLDIKRQWTSSEGVKGNLLYHLTRLHKITGNERYGDLISKALEKCPELANTETFKGKPVLEKVMKHSPKVNINPILFKEVNAAHLDSLYKVAINKNDLDKAYEIYKRMNHSESFIEKEKITITDDDKTKIKEINQKIENGATLELKEIKPYILDYSDNEQDSPLTHAIKHNKPEAVKELLAHGVDANAKQNAMSIVMGHIVNHKTNVDENLKGNLTTIISTLKGHGAKLGKKQFDYYKQQDLVENKKDLLDIIYVNWIKDPPSLYERIKERIFAPHSL